MARPNNVYGSGNSSKIIVNLIDSYFKNKITTSYYNFSNISHTFQDIYSFTKYESNDQFDLVIVLTVWRRNNINSQLMQIKRQSILKNIKTNIIVFQNFYHINIDNIIEEWKKPGTFCDQVTITFIKSPIETGYFGRFISPLISPVTNNAYFIICDDDVIWGDKYFENMIRVVNEGFLATKNGRLITKEYNSIAANNKVFDSQNQVCFNEDIEYDFGGHIWAGRISWLRKAWNHIPFSLENCEDFWISAALKSFYNISTKTPRCPCPEREPIIPDLCAASDNSSILHQEAILGNKTIEHKIRHDLFIELTKKFNYPLMNITKPEYVKNIHKIYVFGDKLWNLTDDLWKNAVNWVG